MCVGIVANSSEFQQSRGPATVIPFWQASFNVSGEFFSHITHIPDVCYGNAVNDFQSGQCEQFWSDVRRDGVLVFAPFILVGLFISIGLESLSKLYKRAQKKAEKGKSSLGGTVTHPPEAPGDIFSWFFCLRSTMIQLPDKQQVKVYVPVEAPSPTPGQTLVAFDMGNILGTKRHVAMLYSPHVVVVRGE
jgi:hypothetical protein